MGHVKALEKTSCKYPVRRVEVKVDTVPTGNSFCEMNLHSQVALFYQLKGSNFRHVGCEIKSKQGVSFGIIFSRNGISFVLIH
jgi:hypothetical protein